MERLKALLPGLFRQYKYVLLIVAAGVALMLLPESGGQTSEPVSQIRETEPDVQQALAEILAQIQGVGKVRVLLTQARGPQTVYAYNEDASASESGSSTRRDLVLTTDESRTQTGLVSQTLMPEYLGAVIVCQGGDQATVRLAVVDAVCDVTGLTADKITVLKMK